MKKNEQLIGEILLDQLPKNILGSLRVMASLTYPISDRRSFIAQLETLPKDSQTSPSADPVGALDLVREAFTAHDFPILTPVSGLEKIFARVSDLYWEDLWLGFNVHDVGHYDEPSPRDTCAELSSMFFGACGDRACEVYRQLVGRWGELTARVAAEAEGRRCMNSGDFIGPSTGSSSGPAVADREWWRSYRRGPTLRGRPRGFPFFT
jgi:hypothetical protein